MVALMIGASVLTPIACLGLLFWLARLEDTLVDDVRKAQHQPSPAPILAFPVQRRPAFLESAATESGPAPAAPATTSETTEVFTLASDEIPVTGDAAPSSVTA